MRCIALCCYLLCFMHNGFAQEETISLSVDDFQTHQRLLLAGKDGWLFKQGTSPGWSNPNIDTDDWQKLNPTELSPEFEDETGRNEGWFRIKIRLDKSFEGMSLGVDRELWMATDIYVNGTLIHSFGDIGNPYTAYNPILKYPIPIELEPEKDYVIAIHFVDYESTFTQREIRLKPENLKRFINLTGPQYNDWVTENYKQTHIYGTLSIGISFLLFLLFWLLVFLNRKQKIFYLIASLSTIVLFVAIGLFYNTFFEITYFVEKIRFVITVTLQGVSVIFGLIVLEWVLTNKISLFSKFLLLLVAVTSTVAHLFSISLPFTLAFTTMLIYFGNIFFKNRKSIKGANFAIVASIIVPMAANFIYIALHKYSLDFFYEYEKLNYAIIVLSAPLFLMIFIATRFKEVLSEVEAEADKVLRITEEKRELLTNQNVLLEKQVDERTSALNQSLENLKATQSQLIQSEKMASLGELTAGIAHEIQNPLNFVNNFSEVSHELLIEMKEELNNGDLEEVREITNDIEQNLEKINDHGKRASDIVKGMLQHSRSSDGKKEPTDINALADEYLRLAYHGMRAKDKSFNATLETDFDQSIGLVNISPQDMGRVVLNLITNAFYAVDEKKKSEAEHYEPTVSVSTKKEANKIDIKVTDNGNGIPKKILDKIFQPFFTTKPTGQGTGLGLSLSYDIVKAHGGELKVETKESQGTTFIIILPLSKID